MNSDPDHVSYMVAGADKETPQKFFRKAEEVSLLKPAAFPLCNTISTVEADHILSALQQPVSHICKIPNQFRTHRMGWPVFDGTNRNTRIILGTMFVRFLFLSVRKAGLSWNCSRLCPDFGFQKKIHLYEKASRILLFVLVSSWIFFVILPSISSDTWVALSSLFLGLKVLPDWLFLGSASWLSVAASAKSPSRVLNYFLFQRIFSQTVFTMETLFRF